MKTRLWFHKYRLEVWRHPNRIQKFHYRTKGRAVSVGRHMEKKGWHWQVRAL